MGQKSDFSFPRGENVNIDIFVTNVGILKYSVAHAENLIEPGKCHNKDLKSEMK